jgi:dienelactone hydrolase
VADTLSDFRREQFSAHGKTRDIYRMGSGPAVVVIAEIPGITPRVAEFGRKVAGIGCTAVLPHLFGEPGADPSASAMVKSLGPACVSREFAILALKKTSPVTVWLRALAAREHERCGGPGVGAVGMCFTGGFALAMAVDPVVLAPVMSQPSIPGGISARKRAALGLDAADLERIKARTREGLCVMGLRFTKDKNVPAERFATLRRELGDAFLAIEIDSSPGNAAGVDPKSHSVLTLHLVDRPGHPTREALDRVLSFLKERLRS